MYHHPIKIIQFISRLDCFLNIQVKCHDHDLYDQHMKWSFILHYIKNIFFQTFIILFYFKVSFSFYLCNFLLVYFWAFILYYFLNTNKFNITQMGKKYKFYILIMYKSGDIGMYVCLYIHIQGASE